MSKFHNVMEQLVIDKLDEIWPTMDMCKCDKCRNDILAYTLNHVTPRYVVSKEGELYVRLTEMSSKHEFNIVIALTKAIQLVAENPRH